MQVSLEAISIGSLGADVMGGCEPPYLGAGNRQNLDPMAELCAAPYLQNFFFTYVQSGQGASTPTSCHRVVSLVWLLSSRHSSATHSKGE